MSIVQKVNKLNPWFYDCFCVENIGNCNNFDVLFIGPLSEVYVKIRKNWPLTILILSHQKNLRFSTLHFVYINTVVFVRACKLKIDFSKKDRPLFPALSFF